MKTSYKCTFVIPSEGEDSFAKADTALQNLLKDCMNFREVNRITREYRVFLKSEPSREITTRIKEITGVEPAYEAV